MTPFGFLLHGSTIPYVNPIELGILGHGIKLVRIDDPKNDINYGILYRNDIKLSDTIFRVGGMCTGFKNRGYCNLIQYDKIGASGRHCIIDIDGNIVLQATSICEYPYYLRGCIASMNDTYYNLKTGKAIMTGRTHISSEHYLFVESSSYWHKEQKDGVYKIEYSTGEFEVIN